MTTIEKFYTAFSKGDAAGMIECYDDNIVFTDPAFGTLEGDRAKAMWQMLLQNKNSELTVTFNILENTETRGKVNWEAKYLFGPSKRKVHNKITANLELKNGKIVRHIDEFDRWKWSRMALGFKGLLLGWTPFMGKMINKTTQTRLDKFMAKEG